MTKMAEPTRVVPAPIRDFERKLRTTVTEYLAVVLILLLGVLLILSSLPVVKTWATDAKALWDLISIVVTSGGTIIGLWFIWLKFVDTRGFASKLEITCTPTKAVLPKTQSNVHALTIKLENKGTLAIEDYEINVSVYLHKGGDIAQSPTPQTGPLLLREPGGGATIDVGAASYAQYVTHVSLEQADAITFMVDVVAQEQHWQNFITVSNDVTPPEEEEKKEEIKK